MTRREATLTEANLRARLGAHTPKEQPKTAATGLASVAAVLRYPAHDAPEVLLIRRPDKASDPWSGHMAFPGGRKDTADRDLVRTAMRETLEEVGVELGASELVGRLDDVQAISGGRPMDLIIVPHVFVLSRDVSLRLEPEEVAQALWAPLLPMLRGERDTVRPYVHEGKRMELPGYQVEGHIVWGLTYRMLELLFEALRR
jgi:8-oxo-dGTP pyrophosphatase MutT (NUDIX family)